MTKKELQKAIESRYGAFVNISQTAEFLGNRRETVRDKYLSGLEYLMNGREKLFYAGDVAQAIVDSVEYAE